MENLKLKLEEKLEKMNKPFPLATVKLVLSDGEGTSEKVLYINPPIEEDTVKTLKEAIEGEHEISLLIQEKPLELEYEVLPNATLLLRNMNNAEEVAIVIFDGDFPFRKYHGASVKILGKYIDIDKIWLTIDEYLKVLGIIETFYV